MKTIPKFSGLMFIRCRSRLLFLAITTLLTGSLFAQRYPEHDHTVFHRPAPPPVKRQSTGAVPGNKPVATPTPSRPADSTRRHDAPPGSPAADQHTPPAPK